MQIQVIGSGCPTCEKLYEVTKEATKDTDLIVEYISGEEGVSKIIELGAMESPLLVVNDKILLTGFNSDVNEIRELINNEIKEG